jgi:hypothetical protein
MKLSKKIALTEQFFTPKKPNPVPNTAKIIPDMDSTCPKNSGIRPDLYNDKN